jgi:predicted permease
MPDEFTGTSVGQDPALYLPLMMDSVATRGPTRLRNNGAPFLRVMVRLRPGIDAHRAASELTARYRSMDLSRGSESSAAERAGHASSRVTLEAAAGGFGEMRDRYTTLLTVLAVMVIAMLLIACANVGSLLVARSASRQREVAVRLSLGARRGRIVRQLLTESSLLSIAGAVLGFVFANWSARALASLLTAGQTIWLDLRLDPRVLAFTTATSVMAVALFGLLPAIGSSRVDVARSLRGGATAGQAGLRVGAARALVTAQVALSVLLVASAVLFTRSLERLYAVNVGFDRENALVARINPARQGYEGERARSLLAELVRRVSVLPGMRYVTLANPTPFDGADLSADLIVDGAAPDEARRQVSASFVWAGPSYFATMRQTMLAGRDIGDRDNLAAPRVAVVNESFARTFFGGQSVLGKRLGRSTGPAGRPNIEIVGVVRDAKDNDLRAPVRPVVYLPFFQNPNPARSALLMRTVGDPALRASSVRSEIRSVDSRLDVLDLTTMRAQVNDTVGREHMVARLTQWFAAAALLLACVGLYGVMAYAVARRTGEIGIRIALGAEPRSVARDIVRQTMVMTLLGLAIGVPVAMIAAVRARSLLFGLGPADPVTLLLTGILLALTALLASWLPARRAARVDPLTALRAE